MKHHIAGNPKQRFNLVSLPVHSPAMAAPSATVKMQLVVSGDHMPSPWVPKASKAIKDQSFITISSQDKQLRQAAGCENQPTRFFSDLVQKRNEATAAYVREALKRLDPQHAATADLEAPAPGNDDDDKRSRAKRARSSSRKSVLDDEDKILNIELQGLSLQVLSSVRSDSSVQVLLEESSIKNLLKAMQKYDTAAQDPPRPSMDRAAASLVNFDEISCSKVIPQT